MNDNENKKKLKAYLILYVAFVIYSFVSICAKYAALQSILPRGVVFLGFEVLFLGLYAILWQQVLKHFTLVHAMASKGAVVLLNLLWSVLLFSEKITVFNVLGAGIIIFGIWMVSTDA